jgi:two-component system chemotaxis response regulator CheY
VVRISEKNRANVKILLADNDSVMRQGLRNAFANEGYKDVRAVGRLSVVREILAGALVDLLILDVETPDGDAIELVSDIRNSRLGPNPFLPIIFVTWDTDPSTINRAANSGVDFILMKPLSPTQLFTRIKSLVSDRKPFVATPGYIGPERREKERWGDIKHFEVPNTLRDKLDGKPVDQAAMSSQIEVVMQEMVSSRMELAAGKLVTGIGTICGAYAKTKTLAGTEPAFASVVATASEIQALGKGDITRLCASLIRIVADMRRNLAEVDVKEIELLTPLTQSIMLAATPNLQQQAVMDEISRAVARFAPKPRAQAVEAA